MTFPTFRLPVVVLQVATLVKQLGIPNIYYPPGPPIALFAWFCSPKPQLRMSGEGGPLSGVVCGVGFHLTWGKGGVPGHPCSPSPAEGRCSPGRVSDLIVGEAHSSL